MNSILGALGRNDVVGLPPVLDLFLMGPRWLAPLYPTLVIIGLLLVAHLVASKRFPRVSYLPKTTTVGLPMACAALGLSIYLLQHHTPSAPGFWVTMTWHWGMACVAIYVTVMIVAVQKWQSRAHDSYDRNIHYPRHFRSPVKLAWYVVTPLSLYLGLTVGVAALFTDTAPRWMQFVILLLGAVWAGLFYTTRKDVKYIDYIFPTRTPAYVREPVAQRPSTRTTGLDDTRSDLLGGGAWSTRTARTDVDDDFGAGSTTSTRTYGSGVLPMPPVAPADVRHRPDDTWTGTGYGTSATPVDGDWDRPRSTTVTPPAAPVAEPRPRRTGRSTGHTRLGEGSKPADSEPPSRGSARRPGHTRLGE